MKSRRLPMEVDIVKYEIGKDLEDGFERFQDIVTKGWYHTAKLIQVTRENGAVVCPYIESSRGKAFIAEGDYIVLQADGTKLVCGANKIWNRYEKPADLEE